MNADEFRDSCPGFIFYGRSIHTCILVFKKCREHPDDVLFIDASAHFDKGMGAIDDTILGYCDELRMETPFY